MKTKFLVIIVIIMSTVISVSVTYYMIDSNHPSKTEQECDLGIHTAKYSINFGNVTYRNQYAIKNGCINEISHDKDVNSLVINFYKAKDGMFQITLPEFLYEVRPRSEHVVLADGEEITFEQLAPSALRINFTENTKTIEIIDFTSTSEPDVTSLKIPNAERDAKLAAGYKPFPGVDWVQGIPQKAISSEPELVTSLPGLQVDVTGQQQIRRGTTHDIVVDVFRDANPVSDALVRITIEDYGEDIIRDFKGRTDDSGRFMFSWEIPKSFDDIKTLLAYVDVTDDISAKTILFKFQVYCLPGETGCKVEGN